MEEIKESHEASLMEMETTHSDTLATLQEEHTRTVKSKHFRRRAPLFTRAVCTWRGMTVGTCVRSENGPRTADKVSGRRVREDQIVSAGKPLT